MDIIDKVAGKFDTDTSRDIIKSLSYILWSTRKNYRYNETYLSDFGDEYFNFLSKYQAKKDFIIDIINELIKDYNDPFLDLRLIIDNVWLFTLEANEKNLQFYPEGNIDRILNRKTYIHLHLEYNGDKTIDQYFEIDVNDESIKSFIKNTKELIVHIKE